MHRLFVSITLPLAVALNGCSPDRPAAIAPEVLSTGAEPRLSLEFDPVPLDPADFELSIEMSVGMTHGAQSQSDRRVAPVSVALHLEADPAASGVPNRGAFTIGDVALSEVGADPEVLKNWKEDLAKLSPRGIKGKLEADSRGRISNVEMKMPNPAPNTIRQLVQSVRSSFELFAVPRPDGALGIGGVLRDRRPVTLSGMDMDLEADYTLSTTDEASLTFDVEMKLRALPQLIELPTARTRDSKAELLGANASGKGRITVPRDRMGPLSGSLALPIEMEVRLLYEGKESVMKSTIDLTLELRPKS